VPAIVVPFRGSSAKRRLATNDEARAAVALAMLGDVVSVCVAVGPTVVVTDDAHARREALDLGAAAVDDPGHGQGAAVGAALVPDAPAAVVNADVPCVDPADVRALVAATPADGLALVEAVDGTTNALSLSAGRLFAPLYGPGSAARFRGLDVEVRTVSLPNLADDVDTIADLERLLHRAGPRTRAAAALLRRSA